MPKQRTEGIMESSPRKKTKFSNNKEFYSDYEFSGMYYGAIIRSSFAGTFDSISTENLPDGYFVITAKDIPGKKTIESPDGKISVPIFCQKKISYKGEALGMVVGPNEEKVLELSKSLSVGYKEMFMPGKKNVSRPSQKISTSNPDEIKEITKELQASGLGDFDFQEIEIETLNVVASRVVKSGSCFGRVKKGSPKGIEEALKICPHIIENTWSFKTDSKDFREPAGAICRCIQEDNNLEVEVFTQSLWLSHMRQTISDVLNVKGDQIQINKTRSTNTSSNAVWYNSVIAAQTALASFVTKKIVKLVYSPFEQKKFMDTMQPITITNKTGCDEDGKILAMDIHINVEAGFYNPFAQEIVDRLAIASYGNYLVPNLQITAQALATFESASSIDLNMLDCASFFAIENQMNEISKKVDIFPEQIRSPEQIRKMNLGSPNILVPKMPFIFGNENVSEYLDKICDDTDFRKIYYSYKMNKEVEAEKKLSTLSPINQKKENRKNYFPKRGIGISCGFEGTCYFGSQMYKDSDPALETIWEDENILTIHTPITSKSSIEILKTKFSKELNISMGNITIDSDFSINEEPLIPDVLNSNISVTMKLAEKCCESLSKARKRKKKFPIYVRSQITKADKKKWNADKFEGHPFFSESYGAAVVDLQIDFETYKIKIRKLNILIDGGKIYNKEAAENTVKLAVHKVLGNFVEGERIIADEIKIDFVEPKENSDKNSSAQIGEIVYQILPSAITQAISQVIGETITSFPIKNDSIFRFLQKQKDVLEKKNKGIIDSDQGATNLTKIIAKKILEGEKIEQVHKD